MQFLQKLFARWLEEAKERRMKLFTNKEFVAETQMEINEQKRGGGGGTQWKQPSEILVQKEQSQSWVVAPPGLFMGPVTGSMRWGAEKPQKAAWLCYCWETLLFFTGVVNILSHCVSVPGNSFMSKTCWRFIRRWLTVFKVTVTVVTCTSGEYSWANLFLYKQYLT